mgnify:CR=1 FL=1
MRRPVDRPAGLPRSAHDLWDTGLPDSDVRQGDLWVLTWDRAVVGHAMIAAALDGFVLAWPVSLPGEPSFAPGLQVDTTPLGVPLTIWPTRETGLGHHLLDRSQGQLLAPDRIRQVAQALDAGSDPGLPRAAGAPNSSEDRDMIDHWADLCFHDGRFADALYLDSEKVKAAGAGSRVTSELLGLPIAGFADVWTGKSAVTATQVGVLADHLRTDPENLVSGDPLGHIVERLALPRFKREIRQRLSEVDTDEATLREAVRSDFALAARDDSDDLTDRKIHDAIRRVGR